MHYPHTLTLPTSRETHPPPLRQPATRRLFPEPCSYSCLNCWKKAQLSSAEKVLLAPLVHGLRRVRAVKGDERGRVLAVLEDGLDVGSRPFRGRGHRRLLGAPVVGDELVAHLRAQRKRQNLVAHAVLVVPRDGVLAARAPGHGPARQHGDGLEVLGARAGDGVRHGRAVAEPGRVPVRRVDAQVGLDRLDHGVGEQQVLAPRVAPALVQAVGRDVDGRVARVERGEAVPGQVAARARNDLRGLPAERVEREDELVRVRVVVRRRQLDVVLPLLVVDSKTVGRRARQRGRLAAAGRGRGGRGLGEEGRGDCREGEEALEKGHACLSFGQIKNLSDEN
ncbi:hypothetical protein PG987_001179 [Apiospora arundinis]